MASSSAQESAPSNAKAAEFFDFSTTHWSIVLAAGVSDLPRAAAAFEWLSQRYWFPIYAYLRRRGASPHDAEDLTQGFFAFLIENETIKKACQERGRFRSFLLSGISNFAANEWNKRRAQKRGGCHQIASLDEVEAEALYKPDLASTLMPEALFDRRWAFTLVELVLKRLRTEFAGNGKDRVFNTLSPWLASEATQGRYAELAKELDMTENNAKVALHRMRRRFGQLLRSEVAHTVTTPAEVDEEIRHLFAAISVQQ